MDNRQFGDQRTVVGVDRIWQYDKAAVRLVREGSHRTLDITGIVHAGGTHRDLQSRPGGLRRAHGFDVRVHFRMEEDQRTAEPGNDLLKRFQPFAAHLRLVVHKPGDIAARAREVRDEAASDWVPDLHEHDRNRTRFLTQRCEPGIPGYDDHVGVRGHQCGRPGGPTYNPATGQKVD